jgi:hypothetical protein
VRREAGQTTVEYILMLAVVVSLFIAAFRTILFPQLQKAQTESAARLKKMLTEPNRMHYLPFAR